MMIYTYRCRTKGCEAVFDIECSLEDHKDTQNCPYCECVDSAKQEFITDFHINVKKSNRRGGSTILNQITFDKE